MLNKDKDYHSYSSLLNFIENGPQSLVTERKKSSKGLSKGKALDDYMYNNFDDKYHVSEVDIKLTSMENKLLEDIINETEGTLSQESLDTDGFMELCNEIIEEKDYFATDRKSKNTADEKIKERINNIKIILSDRIKAGKKEVIDPSLYMDIINMSNKLKNDKTVSPYFDNTNIDIYQNLNQIVLNFTYDNKKFKVVIDNIHIDHRSKTIQVNDLKFTSMKQSDFIKSFFKYRYDIQGTLYGLSLEEFKKENIQFEDYVILEPTFIVVNTEEPPMLYRLTSRDMYSTYYGFMSNYGGYTKGIADIIEDIEYHIENNKFDFSKEYYQNGYQTLTLNRSVHGDRFRSIHPLNRKNINQTEIAEEIDIEVDRGEIPTPHKYKTTTIKGEYKGIKSKGFDKYTETSYNNKTSKVYSDLEKLILEKSKKTKKNSW